MPGNIVTTEDLQKFKEEILKEFKQLLITYDKISIDNWIKSVLRHIWGKFQEPEIHLKC